MASDIEKATKHKDVYELERLSYVYETDSAKLQEIGTAFEQIVPQLDPKKNKDELAQITKALDCPELHATRTAARNTLGWPAEGQQIKPEEVSPPRPRVVTLGDVRAELERLGFSVVSQTGDRVVAVRQKWYWWILSKSTRVVFVQSVPKLNGAQISDDYSPLTREAAQFAFWRFMRSLLVCPVYLAGEVESSARQRCAFGADVTVQQWTGLVYFPAAHDQTTGETFFLRQGRGSPFFPWLRFVVQRLLEPERAPEKGPGGGAYMKEAAILSLDQPGSVD